MYSVKAAQCEDLVVEKYAFLVKKNARYYLSHTKTSVSVEDMEQVGFMGLLDANKNYDPNSGAKFETYATIRIRGAIVDEIRRQSWGSRLIYTQEKDLNTAETQLQKQLGRIPNNNEISEKMGVSVNEFHKIKKNSSACFMHSMSELDPDGTQCSVYFEDKQANLVNNLINEEIKESLDQAITELPSKEKVAVSYHYFSQMKMEDIGSILGVGRSRVSQLIIQANSRLKSVPSIQKSYDSKVS